MQNLCVYLFPLDLDNVHDLSHIDRYIYYIGFQMHIIVHSYRLELNLQKLQFPAVPYRSCTLEQSWGRITSPPVLKERSQASTPDQFGQALVVLGTPVGEPARRLRRMFLAPFASLSITTPHDGPGQRNVFFVLRPVCKHPHAPHVWLV